MALATPGLVLVCGLRRLSCWQIILKWNTQRGVVVIPKAQKLHHAREILDGFFSWTLSNEQKVRSLRAAAPIMPASC